MGQKLFTVPSQTITDVLQRVARAHDLPPERLTARSIRTGSATQLDTVAARTLSALNEDAVAEAGHWAQGPHGNVGVNAYQERPQDRAKAAAL